MSLGYFILKSGAGLICEASEEAGTRLIGHDKRRQAFLVELATATLFCIKMVLACASHFDLAVFADLESFCVGFIRAHVTFFR